MKCPHELHVLDAATENDWTSALRAHVATCESCAEAAGVAVWMESLARIDVQPGVLPDPASLWVRSQFLPPAVAPGVGRPVSVVQVAGYLLVAAAWMMLLASKWTAIHAWMSSFMPASSAEALLPTMPLFFMILGLSSLAMTLAFHKMLAD
jgi:hypothetical protein